MFKAMVNIGMYVTAFGLVVAIVIVSMHFIERGYGIKDLIELIKALPTLIKFDFNPSKSNTRKGIGRFVRIEHPDGFREKGFFLSSQEKHSVGDTIVLKFEIYAKDDGTISLFTEKWKSLFLTMGPADQIVQSPDFAVKIKAREFFTGDEQVEQVPIEVMEPYVLNVKGKVSKGQTKGHIALDFGPYGQFEVAEEGLYQIGGRWRPIKPDLLDLFVNKEYTNTVTIRLAQ
ncbi:MAG: hypothetical protein KKH94_07025 [Candidatus Omnitrophica bacterium]|nr:hypothetical protein [Candidatus Omnitrophota bacterium]